MDGSRISILSTAEAERILQRAATLRERGRAIGAGPAEAPALSPAEAHRHAAWEAMISIDGAAGEAVLLRFHGPAARRQALFSAAAVAAVRPAAADVAALVALAEAMAAPAAVRPAWLREASPLPFEDFFIAPIEAALADLRAGLPPDGPEIAPEAWEDLARDLLLQLTRLAAEPLYRIYAAWRRRPATQSVLRSRFYRTFVDEHGAETLRTAFLTFPVLARLLLRTIAQWRRNTAETLRWLHEDRAAIEALFGRPLGPVGRARALGSDPHRGGRSGRRFDFADGLTLALKPRSLSMEARWRALCEKLAAEGAPALPVAARSLDRGDHGWMEWLEPAVESADPTCFARTLGAMLGLAHLLDGTDLHFENILAVAEGAAAIDLETLLHPRGTLRDETALLAAGFETGHDGVRGTAVWTHLLPSWVTIRNLDDIGMGGLNAEDDLQRGAPRLVDVNTATMRVVAAPQREEARSNLPEALRAPGALATAAPEILAGFHGIWARLAPGGGGPGGRAAEIRALFDGAVARVILRPTQVYFLLLRRALAAEALVDGAAFSGQFDFLLRFADPRGLPAAAEPILDGEIAALERLDIPFFTSPVGATALEGDVAAPMPEALTRAGLDAVAARLSGMTSRDRDFQAGLIAASLGASGADAAAEDAAGDAAEPAPAGSAAAPAAASAPDDAGPARLRAAAEEIGARLLECSTDGRGGAWLSLTPTRGYSFAQIEMTRPDLYAGSLGVAIFLAELARATGAEIWAEAARRAAAQAVAVQDSAALTLRMRSVSGVGVGTGLGGLVYGFLRIGDALGEERWLARARSVAQGMAAPGAHRDRTDLLDGGAGAILALLALAERAAGPHAAEAEALAGAWGRWLIDAARREPTAAGEALVWPSLRDRALAGMAHGGAGIAMALARLGARTGRAEFTEAARMALRFERAVFEPERGGWPDLRAGAPGGEAGRPPMLNRWCHGAAGIGLARLGTPGWREDPEMQAEIEAAIAATRGRLGARIDGLCCGNFGRIAFLQAAGAALERPALCAEARAGALARLARRERCGAFAWAGGGDEVNVGLFTGMAGVGLLALELAAPEAARSVLQWR